MRSILLNRIHENSSAVELIDFDISKYISATVEPFERNKTATKVYTETPFKDFFVRESVREIHELVNETNHFDYELQTRPR